MFLLKAYIDIYYPPSTTLKGDIETVSVHPSVRPKRKSSHSHNFSPILTKFLHHVHITKTFYNMQFHKKVPKIVAVATVFLLKL